MNTAIPMQRAKPAFLTSRIPNSLYKGSSADRRKFTCFFRALKAWHVEQFARFVPNHIGF
jgi:hypothetical protein